MLNKLLADKVLLVFAALALSLAGICYHVGGEAALLQGLGGAGSMLLEVGPRLLAAFVMAGFIQVLLPKDLVTRWVGTESGLQGLLIATVAGMFTPGGPMLAFPLLVTLQRLGAGYGALVAYLTSWEILNIYRAVIWDIPFMGLDFTVMRFAVSLFLPLLAGWIAQRIVATWGSTYKR